MPVPRCRKVPEVLYAANLLMNAVASLTNSRVPALMSAELLGVPAPRCRKVPEGKEPDPSDPLKVARHTNEVAEKDPLLATVPMVPLRPALNATLSFLPAMKTGSTVALELGHVLPGGEL